jgi:hypothetical protein
MNNFLFTVKWCDDFAYDYSTVGGHGAEGVELKERNEVVRAKGEDKGVPLFFRFISQQGIPRII